MVTVWSEIIMNVEECNFCRAMLCKPMPSCGVRPSVRPSVPLSVTLVNSVKTSNGRSIFKMFPPSGSQTIVGFFRSKRHDSIPTGSPLLGQVNAGGVCTNRDYRRIADR